MKLLNLYPLKYSLENNFAASATGCMSPQYNSFVGPFRKWAYPRSLRSNNVKKATLVKIPAKIPNPSNTTYYHLV